MRLLKSGMKLSLVVSVEVVWEETVDGESGAVVIVGYWARRTECC